MSVSRSPCTPADADRSEAQSRAPHNAPARIYAGRDRTRAIYASQNSNLSPRSSQTSSCTHKIWSTAPSTAPRASPTLLPTSARRAGSSRSTGALSSSSRASGLSRRSPGSVRQQTRRSKMRRSDSIVPSSQRSSRAPHRANHRSSRSRNSTRPLPAFCARLPSRPGCRPPHARRQRARRCRLPSHRRWSSCSPRHPSRAQMSRQIVRCQQGKEQ
mmetsp:Transcript_20710/g.52574  ORF Transcript_20710/g.52574 Transcript_20710/m.52574 type:complete len:215 (-) Transcript_20710:540-1184(-)